MKASATAAAAVACALLFSACSPSTTPRPGNAGDFAEAGGRNAGQDFVALDTAVSWISRPGAFDCPQSGGDCALAVADMVASLGVRHVRDRISWTGVSPRSGEFDAGPYLRNARLMHERGISVCGVFHDCPPYAAPLRKLPSDLGETYRFCRRLAAEYGDLAEAWEFWNEPDIHYAPEPVWDYAAALKAAALGFRSGNPRSKVLNGSLCTPVCAPYLRGLLANGIAPFIDVFNVHCYLTTNEMAGAFGDMREILQEYGAEHLPVWVTECGSDAEGDAEAESARPGLNAHSPRQERIQAETLVTAMEALRREGVERAYGFVFGAYNGRGGAKDWGMLRRDGTQKPVCAAVAKLAGEDAARTAGAAIGHPVAGSAPPSIVLRADLSSDDFWIGGMKTEAHLVRDFGRIRVSIWNLSDEANTGTIAVAGCRVTGLPAGPFPVAPFAMAEFECVVQALQEGSLSLNDQVDMVFAGDFEGKPSSPLVIPIVFEKPLLDQCGRHAISWDRPEAWKRNASAQMFAVAFDKAEDALRFDCAWTEPGDRWCYPEYALSLPDESLAGAEYLEFDVRSAQDKPENDFSTANLMLVFEDGSTRRIPFAPPLDGWEMRRVILRGISGLGTVRAIRIGANPRGTRLSLWIRDILILQSRHSGNTTPPPLCAID